MKVFSFYDLIMATKGFISDAIISAAPSNVVYRGTLRNNLGYVAIKRFKNSPSDDRGDFRLDAIIVGMLKHKRLVKLMGYCCNRDEILLVAEYMPNDTLAQRLFYAEKIHTMEWSMRLRVAYHIAEALHYCDTEYYAPYRNLNAYSVLFDKDDEVCLSSFGLMRAIGSKLKEGEGGSVHPENVIYRFGLILVNLLTGEQIPPSEVPELINVEDVTKLMDSNLKGKYSIEEATAVLKLISECLQCTERKNHLVTKDLVERLKALNTKREAPSSEVPETTNQDEVGASSSETQQVEPLSEVPSSEVPETTNQDEVGTSSSEPEQVEPLTEVPSSEMPQVTEEQEEASSSNQQ